jgi:alkanesulfonate monooxygenase SsuD/methylene tetrahydromethanopterin reductase-like flavin-dependent oxidoreductase (luciferase family)
MAGRGSFVESFPLFGLDLKHYDELFEENLRLLLEIRENEVVNWSGRHRASIEGLGVYPRPVQEPLPVWIAVGGTPQSVVRAGTLGLPLAFAIIGGAPERFAPFIDLYRETGRRAGHAEEKLRVGINSHAFLADSSQVAADTFYPAYADTMTRIGQERGWPPTTRMQFEAARSLHGALLVGSAQEVIDKILYQYGLFRNDRFLLQMSVGTMPHRAMLRSIELLGTVVAPVIRRETSS